MSKVNKGGNKVKKQKKGENISKRELIVKEEANEFYGIVTSALGNCRFSVLCDDSVVRVCKLGNTLRKKMDVYEGLLVLIGVISENITEDTDKKGFILHGYVAKEVKKLIKDGEIESKEILDKLSVRITGGGDDDAFEFADEIAEPKTGYMNGKLVEISSDEEEEKTKDDDFDIDDI